MNFRLALSERNIQLDDFLDDSDDFSTEERELEIGEVGEGAVAATHWEALLTLDGYAIGSLTRDIAELRELGLRQIDARELDYELDEGFDVDQANVRRA